MRSFWRRGGGGEEEEDLRHLVFLDLFSPYVDR
jgi:hypothetical protein